MKFIELTITREEGVLKIKAKSPFIAKYLINSFAVVNGIRIDQMQTNQSRGSLWQSFKYYPQNSPIEGISFSLERHVGDENATHAPWLQHKDLGEGIELTYNLPVSAEAARNYARRLKECLQRFYDQHMAPFEIEMEITLPEDVMPYPEEKVESPEAASERKLGEILRPTLTPAVFEPANV